MFIFEMSAELLDVIDIYNNNAKGFNKEKLVKVLLISYMSMVDQEKFGHVSLTNDLIYGNVSDNGNDLFNDGNEDILYNIIDSFPDVNRILDGVKIHDWMELAVDSKGSIKVLGDYIMIDMK